MNDIFQIDWVFVDTIIIILLFLLLVGVKIFKSTHRWRMTFSNEALEHLDFPNANKIVGNQFFRTKKWSLTRNSSLKELHSKSPLILVLRTTYKRKLLRILTESLCSYGFNIINVRIKIKQYPDSKIFEKHVISELKSLVSAIINYFSKKDLVKNQNYILLNHLKSSFDFRAILTDNKNKGIILINPKVNKENLINYQNIIDNNLLDNYLYTIFSKRSIFILPNRNLKCLIARFPSQDLIRLKIYTLDKAKNSFKYYETIVLGLIIDIIENKLL